MKFKIISFLIIISIFSNLFSEPAAFLRVGVSAKESAMGSAMTAFSEGISSMEYNPAGLSYISQFNIMAGYSSIFENTYNYGLFIGLPLNFIKLGAGFSQLGSGEIIINEHNSYSVSTFNYSSKYFVFSGAFQFLPFNIGINIKYLTQNLYEYSQSAVTFDLGAISDFDFIKMGFAIKNILNTKFGDENLPTILQAGLGLKLNLQKIIKSKQSTNGIPIFLKITSEIDYITSENNSLTLWGFELIPSKFFSICLGFNNGISFGLGVNINFIQANFGIILHDVLDPVYKISTVLKF